MQNDGLFAGSIAENIASFDERPDAGWIEECAARAAILADIKRTPMGSRPWWAIWARRSRAARSSGVILARALYRKPEILFLDEATSHLDEATEAVIAEALRDLRMTRIIVAHRPATIAGGGPRLHPDALHMRPRRDESLRTRPSRSHPGASVKPRGIVRR